MTIGSGATIRCGVRPESNAEGFLSWSIESRPMAERQLRDLRAVVVGTGFIGVVHVEALRRLGVQIAGVVGSSPARVEAKAPQLGWPRAYESFEAMLDDGDVDVVHL